MQDAKNRHLGTIAQFCRAISSQMRHVSTIGKKILKQQYLIHMFPQYGKLRPTSGWDRSGSLGHPCKFQRVSHFGSVTARHSSCGRRPNFAALNRGRHLYSAGRPSRWHWPTFLLWYKIRVYYDINVKAHYSRIAQKTTCAWDSWLRHRLAIVDWPNSDRGRSQKIWKDRVSCFPFPSSSPSLPFPHPFLCLLRPSRPLPSPLI